MLSLAGAFIGHAEDFSFSPNRPLTNVAQLCRAASGEGRSFYRIELLANALWISPTRDQVVLQDDSGTALVQADLREQPTAAGEKIFVDAHCGLASRNGGEIVVTSLTVDNDGVHDELEQSGAVFLSAGRHPIRLAWFNRSGTGDLKVHYAGAIGGPQRIPSEKLFRVAGVANGITNWANGLDYRCFTGKWDRLPDFHSLPLIKSGVATNFDITVASRTDRVGLEFAGFVEITRPGIYTFSTRSDDGSQLLVGDVWMRCKTSGSANLPEPIPLGQALSEEQEFVWAQLEGRVTFAGEKRGGWELEVSSGATKVFADVTSVLSKSAPPQLNSRVRVTGVCRKTVAQDGSLSAGKFLVPGAEHVELLEAPSSIFVSSNAEPASTVLTTIEQIHHLTREQAKREYPVKISGVVTCVSEDSENAMIQDATRGIFIPNLAPAPGEFPRVGDYMEVEGATAPGDFAPIVYARRVKRLGVAPLPAPRAATWDQLMNGSLDIQFVELEGIVTGVYKQGLNLLMHDGRMNVRLMDPEAADLHRYENALVRMRGCVSAIWSGRTHQVKPGIVLLHTWSIEVDEPAPVDLFDIRLKRAGELLQFDARAGAFQRVKVAGTVVHVRDNECFLMDGTDGLRFTPRNKGTRAVGDEVELVGFPFIDATAPVLRDAVVRRIGHRTLPEPQLLSATNLLNKENDATLVTLEARVSNISTNSAEQVLELQTDAKTFLARLNATRGRLTSLPIGSVVKLTGVYVGTATSAESKAFNTFELLLNSPADVKILQRPSWWTAQHTVTALGVSLAILLLAGAWISGLRRQVERRTRELKREIEERKRAQQEVEAIHKKLVSASHAAGMAEVATSVLHNVGNVLNSVNVSATLLASHIQQSKLTALAKLADWLQRHRDDSSFLASDERGRQIPDYVKRLNEQAQHEREVQLGEVESLQKNIEHIKSIVVMQQNYARMGGVAEEISVSELVEDAVRINTAGFERHRVKLMRDFQVNPEIEIERHKALQILVNLLQNAKQACTESGRIQRHITLRILPADLEHVRIEITDDGTGIDPENFPRLFRQGFTTRKDGHGFGLHSAANLAKELGGTLTAHSDGTGQGATFALTLPTSGVAKSRSLAAVA
jgi:signal transduction histidine kinase